MNIEVKDIFDAQSRVEKNGRYYKSLDKILSWHPLGNDLTAQKSLIDALQSPHDKEASLEAIAKFLDSRNAYGPTGGAHGSKNFPLLLKILKNNFPDALIAFADKIESVFTAFAQREPRHFFQLCGQLASTPDILSRVVSHEIFQQATENYFSTIHTANHYGQRNFAVDQNINDFKLHVFTDYIHPLEKIPAYRDAERAGIAAALAKHTKAGNIDSCIAIISRLGEFNEYSQPNVSVTGKKLLAAVSGDAVAKIARLIEEKAAEGKARPDLMPLVHAFKGLSGLAGLAPTQIQEQIHFIADEIDLNYRTATDANAPHRRDGLRSKLVLLTDVAINMYDRKESILTPEHVQQITGSVLSASPNPHTGVSEYAGNVCNLFDVLRPNAALTAYATERAMHDGIVSDGHWGVFPAPDAQGQPGLVIYEWNPARRAGWARGDLTTFMQKLRQDKRTDAIDQIDALLVIHKNGYQPIRPAGLQIPVTAKTREHS